MSATQEDRDISCTRCLKTAIMLGEKKAKENTQPHKHATEMTSNLFLARAQAVIVPDDTTSLWRVLVDLHRLPRQDAQSNRVLLQSVHG